MPQEEKVTWEKVQAVIKSADEVMKTRDLAKFVERLNKGEIDLCILINSSTLIQNLVEYNAVTILNFLFSLEDDLKEDGCYLASALKEFNSMIHHTVSDDYFPNGIEAFEIVLEKMPDYLFTKEYEYEEEYLNEDAGPDDNLYEYEYVYYTLEQLAIEFGGNEVLDAIQKEMKKRGIKSYD